MRPALDYAEPFPKDVLKLLGAYPVSTRVSHYIGVRSLGDVRSLEHSANISDVATRGLVSYQSSSASPDISARFHRKTIILEFNRNAVLKLPVDQPAT